MLPDLEKIINADRRAKAALDAARKEAEELISQAAFQVQAIEARLQEELDALKRTVQEEVLSQAEAQAAATEAAAQRYLQALAEKQAARREEAVAFMVSRVLGP